MAKVHVEGGHWIWRGRRQFRLGASNSRRVLARKAAVAIFVGPINGRMVVSGCGVASCVKPKHQRLVRSGRNGGHSRRLSALPWWGSSDKLNPDKVRAIVMLRKNGAPIKIIAQAFGVTAGNVSAILGGAAWKRLGVERVVMFPKHGRPISDAKRRRIVALGKQGLTRHAVAKRAGVAWATADLHMRRAG